MSCAHYAKVDNDYFKKVVKNISIRNRRSEGKGTYTFVLYCTLIPVAISNLYISDDFIEIPNFLPI